MRIEKVEIYSDNSNAAVLRHPGRKYPGILVQGDSLFSLCTQADEICAGAKRSISPNDYSELNELRNALWGLLNHYKAVLGEHSIPLPFSDGSGV
jgi:hypothetical protein